jgi:hypothetical protein
MRNFQDLIKRRIDLSNALEAEVSFDCVRDLSEFAQIIYDEAKANDEHLKAATAKLKAMLDGKPIWLYMMMATAIIRQLVNTEMTKQQNEFSAVMLVEIIAAQMQEKKHER